MKQLATTAELREGLVLRAYRQGFGYAGCGGWVTRILPYHPEDSTCASKRGGSSAICGPEPALRIEMKVAGKFVIPPDDDGGSGDVRRFLAIAHTGDISSSSERKCLKAAVSLPFRFFTIRVARSDRSFYTEEIHYLDGTITMMSDREAVLETDHDLPLTALLRGRLGFDENDIDVTARIVNAESGSPNRYDIEYTGMSDRERNRILEYVFSIYRE